MRIYFEKKQRIHLYSIHIFFPPGPPRRRAVAVHAQGHPLLRRRFGGAEDLTIQATWGETMEMPTCKALQIVPSDLGIGDVFFGGCFFLKYMDKCVISTKNMGLSWFVLIEMAMVVFLQATCLTIRVRVEGHFEDAPGACEICQLHRVNFWGAVFGWNHQNWFFMIFVQFEWEKIMPVAFANQSINLPVTFSHE